jgi:hypothetical protein
VIYNEAKSFIAWKHLPCFEWKLFDFDYVLASPSFCLIYFTSDAISPNINDIFVAKFVDTKLRVGNKVNVQTNILYSCVIYTLLYDDMVK